MLLERRAAIGGSSPDEKGENMDNASGTGNGVVPAGKLEHFHRLAAKTGGGEKARIVAGKNAAIGGRNKAVASLCGLFCKRHGLEWYGDCRAQLGLH